MITFHYVKWKNFLSAGNTWTEIELDTHKNTLIMGHNGSGKSTFLDAIVFVLFGKPFRKVNKGNVVNSINGKNCEVEIEFTVSNKRYKIIRGAKPNIFEIYCEGKMVNQDAAAKDYQEHLEKYILKMNFKSFTQVVILGSASFVPFMQLSPSDRRAVIEDLLDIQIFSAMSNVVKNRLQINREGLEKNRILLTSKEEAKTYIESTLESLKVNNESKVSQLREKEQELKNSLVSQQTVISDLEGQRDTLIESGADTSALKSKHSKLVGFRAKMENNRDRHVNDIDFFAANGSCPTCRQDINQEFAKTMVESNTAKIAEINEGLNKVTEQIDHCLNEIEKVDEVLKKINDLRVSISSAKTSYNSIENNLAQIIDQIETFAISDKTTQDSERQLAQVQHDISTTEEEKKTLLDERTYIDLATTLLKDGGIKTKIINESFEESIKSRYRDEFSYHNFSEGEKLRIDLAILLTWRQIAKLKNSVNVNILVFDEILDRAMDASGTDEFIKIMWDMGDKGTNIFVISHKDAMIDRFQRTIKFEKVKNFSVLTKDM